MIFFVLADSLLLRSGRPQTMPAKATGGKDGDGLIPSDRTQTTHLTHAVLDNSGAMVILDSAELVWQTFGSFCYPPLTFIEWTLHFADVFAMSFFAKVAKDTSSIPALESFRARAFLHPSGVPVAV